LCRCLVQAGIRRENGAAALPLVANYSSHFVSVSNYSMSVGCQCLLLLTRLVGGRRRCRWWSSRLRKGKTLNISTYNNRCVGANFRSEATANERSLREGVTSDPQTSALKLTKHTLSDDEH
jgi:hypothetical protein